MDGVSFFCLFLIIHIYLLINFFTHEKKTNRGYDAPKVEILNARVEKGFEGSNFKPSEDPQSNDRYNNGGDLLFS